MKCPDCHGKLRVYRTYHKSDTLTRHYSRCQICQSKHWTETHYGGPLADVDFAKPVANKEIWLQTQHVLKGQMTRATYDAVIRDTEFLSRQNGSMVLLAKTALSREWLEKRLYETIKRTINQLDETVHEIKFMEAE